MTVIGILGDGQLGRMEIERGSALGYSFAVLGPGGRNSPAGQLATWAEAWDSEGNVCDRVLDAFCSRVSVVTIDTENVSVKLVDRIEARGKPVRPGSKVLRVSQDRLLEKTFAESLGIPVAPYRTIASRTDLAGRQMASERSILKTRRGGYDSLGQIVIDAGCKIEPAWHSLKCVPCILEQTVQFVCEFSVIVFRNKADEMLTYGPFENTHKDGILDITRYPARTKLPEQAQIKAIDSAIAHSKKIATCLDLVGILAIEYFVLEDGTVLFNEMAPRPHNSGHLTMDCCDTCQFEQYVRVASDLPWGSSHFHHAGEMTNILGADIGEVPRLLKADAKLHLYGKPEARTRRKMGHYTKRFPLP